MKPQDFQLMQEKEAQQVPQIEEQSQSQGKPPSSQGVFEIAIVARVIWDLHSLNNEGTIGNVTEPRTIVLWDGTKTDGVSGEMMKHIHAYWTWLQAKTQNLSLCDACKHFQPQRADAHSQGLNRANNAEAMSTAIKRCVLCDLHGFLVQRPTIHRQSVVEFGWLVGVPGKFNRDIHVHARHAAAGRGVSEEARGGEGEPSAEPTTDETERTEVAAQMVYHRPTRSGVYALVTLFQPWRIGLNEVNYSYILDHNGQDNKGDNEEGKDGRKNRYRVALTAYEWTLKRPDGAMTTTRFPHIEGIEGIVLISWQAVPVPMLSPLREDYREKLKTLAQKQQVEAKEFNDLDELVDILAELQKSDPLRMPFATAPSSSESAPAEGASERQPGWKPRGSR